MERRNDPPIAIIGMGSLFAQATDLIDYWRLLYRGVDAITEPPHTHAHLNDYYDPDPTKADHIYCKRGGFIPPLPFDPTEFGIPPATLEATDTSQLLGLIAAKMALKDAGYGEDNDRPFDREKTSVILGVTGTQELVINLGSRLGHPKWQRALDAARITPDKAQQVIASIADAYVPWQENSFPGLLGNVVAGRVCNRLDLGGTNCTVDAACASSLSAVHMALMELFTGRSRMVVTGGVDTLNDIFMHMCFSKTGVLSKSGDARPFSKDADGTVLGEGVGLLVLKPLADAVQDKDRIYAVIKGLGSSSDGRSQSIYAPRAEGQIRALEAAYRRAGVTPDTIDLVEAHGTGTRVGDQVEFESLCKVFSQRSHPSDRCALGSVKSMIGHTKAAAGAAGLIKAALSLYHKVFLPTLKADPPDPKLDLEKSPFYLSSHARPWPTPKEHPRRAAVSAFGFGGSNFHAVLEEYKPQRQEPAWDHSVEIFAFSGEHQKDLLDQLKGLIQTPKQLTMPGSSARLAALSRKQFRHGAPQRVLLRVEDQQSIVEPIEKIIDCLSQNQELPRRLNSTRLFYGNAITHAKVAMVFPGQGSQYINMGRDIFCVFPEALAVLDRAAASWSGEPSIADLLFPIPTQHPEETAAQETRLRHTHCAQMALGTVEAAMLAVLQRFNVTADAYCGHSYGELAALSAAGWIDLDTLLNLSDARGRCMAKAGDINGTANGQMLAISAPLDQIEQMAQELSPDVVLANRNSPVQGVLSGTQNGIENAMTLCHQKGWRYKRLPVSAAFHSPLIEPAAESFQSAVHKAHFTTGRAPVYSNVSGAAYPKDMAAARALLQQQMRSGVDFVAMIHNLYHAGTRTYLEVGPKSVLTGLITAILGENPATVLSVDASSGRKNGLVDMADLLCHLASTGYPVELTQWGAAPDSVREPRMQVMLSGANLKRQQDAPVTAALPANTNGSTVAKPVREPVAREGMTTPLPQSSKTDRPTRPHLLNNTLEPSESVTSFTKNRPTSRTKEIPSMSVDHKKENAPIGHIKRSLAIAQQGIDALQALHLKTAQTHQKFLEAQTEASRTLQAMINQTHQLVEAPLESAAIPSNESPHHRSEVEGPQIDATVMPLEAIPTSQEVSANPSGVSTLTAEPIPSSLPTPHQVQHPDSTLPATPKPEPTNGTVLEARLLEVVSELTGYPHEMLELSMDIESDLGIDSIKRVEILSSLEERLPELPTITPEMLGSLKTLGQIVDYLAGPTQDRSVQVTPAPPETIPVSPKDQPIQPNQVERTLLETVSELTGYPHEMLELSMDIESDLGIDSIKRVEILSSLEERLPELPAITPEMLGSLKTLGQIVDYLAGPTQERLVQVAPASPQAIPVSPTDNPVQPDQVQRTLLATVSDLTGYPLEMLELSMDIESDLGIDSIKRVEILSSLEERLPELPAITPEMLGSLKTLGQIIDYLTQSPSQKGPIPLTDQPSNDHAAPDGDASTGSRDRDNGSAASMPGNRVQRQVVSLKPIELSTQVLAPLWNDSTHLYITRDEGGLSQYVARAFEAIGIPTTLLTADLNDLPECLDQLAGLILMAPISAENAFLLAHKVGPQLSQRGQEKSVFSRNGCHEDQSSQLVEAFRKII